MIRLYEVDIRPTKDAVYVCATIEMGPANPIRYVGELPEWRPPAHVPTAPEDESRRAGFFKQERKPFPKGRLQFLEVMTLGLKTDDRFVPVIRFGLADDRRAQEKAHVTPWVSDGKIDYFGQYARPNTPYDFKIHLDLKRKRMTAWVCGRGDDDWFLLAEDVPLASPARAVDHVKVEMYPDAPAISRLNVRPSPEGPDEQILPLPHPLAKKDRVVEPDHGFRFQSMRSTWRKPGRHVTIFREPGVHAGFPDVAQAGPNHLVCDWMNSSHTGGTGGISVAHSYDLGKTWSKPVEITRRGHCPRLQRLKDGMLLLLSDEILGGNQFTATWNLRLWDSTDGGKTWTNERLLETKKVGGDCGCIVPSRICEMADGSWLLAASYFAPHGENLDYYRSTDRGKTWQFLGAPDNRPYSLSEPSPVQLPDGRLVVYARESRYDGKPGAKGYSKDGGKTWQYQELPHPIIGRTCAGLLRDGRIMNTFRSGIGRAALWAWVGSPDDPTTGQPAGGHFNDHHSVGLKDGALHIDNDGMCGQFTNYTLRPPDTAQTTVDLTFEVKVLANQGRAATVSIPFAGKLRLFPDHLVMAHDPSLRVAVTPGKFHTYRVVSRIGKMQLYVDGKLQLDTDRADSQIPTGHSIYSLQFGNESKGVNAMVEDIARTLPDVYPANITPEVTGYSIWRRFEATLDDPETGKRILRWTAAEDGFPDQYQLDHIIEVDASASGHEQGYSGWIQLDDGRIFVVHYTDDTSAASTPNPFMFGVPWIRGTFVEPGDLPVRKVTSQH